MREIKECFEHQKTVVVFIPHGDKYQQEFMRQMAVMVREALPKSLDALYVDIGGTGAFSAVLSELKEELSGDEYASLFRLWGAGGLRELQYESLGALVVQGDRSFSRVPVNRPCVLYGYRASEADTGVQGVALVNDMSERARIFGVSTVIAVEVLEDGSIPPAFWDLSSRPYVSIVNRSRGDFTG